MMNPIVDNYLKKAKNWKLEMEALGAILFRVQLKKKLNGGSPCKRNKKKNFLI